jgi:hypothetical protein
MASAQEVDGFGIPKREENADLARERKNGSFNVQELTYIVDGGPDRTKRRKELGKDVNAGFQISAQKQTSRLGQTQSQVKGGL